MCNYICVYIGEVVAEIMATATDVPAEVVAAAEVLGGPGHGHQVLTEV